MTTNYTCTCGRIFDNPQAFNGHKSHCKTHQLNKYGNLSNLTQTNLLRAAKISKTLSNKNKTLKQDNLIVWISEQHKCEKCNKIMTEYYGSGRFCSKACACSRIKSEETKEKIANTLKTNAKTFNKSVAYYTENLKHCIICGTELSYTDRHRSTCSDKCLKALQSQLGHIGGIKSALIKCTRSKNEIEFCKLCEDYFGQTEVLHNVPMFNGWDADIIIPKHKLAILWNGPWHYRKVTKSHNLAQVQNRDKIKIEEIRNSGYSVYIIKDSGKESVNKVQNEFSLFLDYLMSI